MRSSVDVSRRPRADLRRTLVVVLLVALLAAPAALIPGGVRNSASPGPTGPTLSEQPLPPTAPRSPGPSGLPPLPAPCGGPWPAFSGPLANSSGCDGRDQAVAGFYSSVPGGAGNVSLQLILPVDRSPTANQSDLYRAIWVGLVLADPMAWMGECFLQVRFQPDASWTSPVGGLATSTNNWTGTVVGWMIDPATGAVDDCVDQPLFAAGSSNTSYLALHGGDTLNVTTSGVAGSAAGETVVVNDTTTSASAMVSGLNDRGTPLAPAYATADVLNALAGTAAAIPPVSIGVELAGGANPSVPDNATFGGCTPGVPPATPANPSVPCPSYDPTSWINDTASPLRFSAPTFSAATSARSSEVVFSSSVGGTTGVTELSNKTCTGRVGSAYCTYPWYSYSCGAASFEFGATDYSGVTTDFGEENQYGPTAAPGLLGYPQYAGNAFAVPGCGIGALNVSVGVSSGIGTVQLLNTNYTTPTAVSLAPGSYAISAVATPGESFAGWTVTGGTTVAFLTRATTSLLVSGAGSAVARFTATPAMTNVTFQSVRVAGGGSSGGVEVGSAVGSSAAGPLTYVPNGSTILLGPGTYPIEAAPSNNSSFLAWSTTGGAVPLERFAPATWLSVTSAGGAATVTASLGAAPNNVTVVVRVAGNGTVRANAISVPYFSANSTSFGAMNVSAGTVALVAQAAPGWQFTGWSIDPGGVALPNGSAETNLTISRGVAYAFGAFAALVHVVTTPASAGQVAFDGGPAVSNGSAVPLTLGTHALGAAPYGGYAFVRWLVSNASALWVTRPMFPITRITVNASGTVTAVYTNATGGNLTLQVNPGAGGFLEFNFENLTANPTVNASVAPSTYELRAIANYGYRFAGWNVTGPASVVPGQLTVTGSGAVVTARFAARFFPVTFVVTRPGSVSFTVNRNVEPSGATLALARGVYPVTATVVAANSTFLGWSSSLPIGNVSASHANATVTVDGSGTVFGIVAGFVLSGFTLSPTTTDVGATVHITVSANGTGPLSYRYSGLPPNCNSLNRPTLTCRPVASGDYPIHATVTDSGGAVESTPTAVLTVDGDPMIAGFTATPSVVDLGIPVSLAVTVQQGLGPYAYQYTNLPPGCTSTSGPKVDCSPSGVGTFLVQVTVTDSLGLVASSSTSLLVEPNLKVSAVAASRPSLDVGVPTYVNVSATGGTSPYTYTYAGLPKGCSPASGPTVTCVPTAAGVANITVTVRDTFGFSATGRTTVTVQARPTVAAFAAAPANLTLGQATEFTVATAGGTGTIVYSYAGLPTGCPATGASSFTCTPNATGTFEVTVTIGDTDSQKATATTNVTIVPVPGSHGPNPGGSPTSQIQWKYVGLIAGVALLIAIVLVWRFGRPPKVEPVAEAPETPAPAAPR